MYNYVEAVKDDIKDWMEENELELIGKDRDELEEFLNDTLWVTDSVTGNASGSYTFNRWQAKEYVLDDVDMLRCAAEEFGIESINLLDEDWEAWDVTIRCYLLGGAIHIVLNEMEEKEEV